MGKTSMSRRAGGVAIGIAAMLVATSCAIGEDADGDVVVIGADLDLTGAGAELSAVYRNALELRVEQVNDQGLLGDRRLELDIRDNRSDEAVSAENIAELAGDSEVSAIVLGGCTACAVAVAEAGDITVPVIALGGPDSVSEPVEERQYIFKLGPDTDHTASALVGQLPSDAETIGLVTIDDAYGADGERAMAQAADRGGVEIVVRSSVTADEESITDAAREMYAYQPDDVVPPIGVELQQGPDAVVVWAPPGPAADAVVSLREVGYEGPVYLDPAAADSQFLVGQRASSFRGTTMIFTETLAIDEVIATSPARAARKTWFSDYGAEYGSYNAFSSFAADAVQLVVDAIRNGRTDEPETLRSIIETTQMEGLTGTIRMSPRQHAGLMPQALVPLVARDDRWSLA